MFSFGLPWVFLCIVLPILVLYFAPASQREEAAIRVPFFKRAEMALSQVQSFSHQHSWVKLVLLGLIWVLLICAGAKPQIIGEAVTVPASGRDLLVAVDISGSMEQTDMMIEGQQIQRIHVVKYVVGDFLERRLNDRLGLILFGSQAYLQAPLTFDRKTVNRLLQEAQLGFAGKRTAIGDAIGLAIKRLKDRPESQRVLILLTDGDNTSGEVLPRQAADLAKQANVKIYTIGVGADEMIQQRGFFSQRVNPSLDLDEGTLRYIAETTGGQYFRAKNPKELAQIYALLDELEPVEQDEETFRPTKNLFFWPLAFAIFLSFIYAAYSAFAPFLFRYMRDEVN